MGGWGVKNPKLFSEKQCHVFIAHMAILGISFFMKFPITFWSGLVGGWGPLFKVKVKVKVLNKTVFVGHLP